MPMMTPLQMKLARTAEVAPSTVQRFESGRGDMHSRTLDRVQQVLEEAGVIFIGADASGGPGVRLKA